VRELSFYKQFPPSEADQAPDFDLLVKRLQFASFNLLRSSSLGIIANEGMTSQVTVRSFSFHGADESADDFTGNICSMKPSTTFVKNDALLPSSLKRERDDGNSNSDLSSRKIFKTDWDALLCFDL